MGRLLVPVKSAAPIKLPYHFPYFCRHVLIRPANLAGNLPQPSSLIYVAQHTQAVSEQPDSPVHQQRLSLSGLGRRANTLPILSLSKDKLVVRQAHHERIID